MHVREAIILAGSLFASSAVFQTTPDSTTADTPLSVPQVAEDCDDVAREIEQSVPPEEPVRGRRDGFAARMTPDLVGRVMEVLRDVDPALAERMKDLESRDRERFVEALRKRRRLIGLAELKAHEPSLYEFKLAELKVDADVARTTAQLRSARRSGSAADVEQLEIELRKHVSLQVYMSIAARAAYLKRLERHIQHLRDQIDRDVQNVETAVERRMAELLVDEDAPAATVARRDRAGTSNDN